MLSKIRVALAKVVLTTYRFCGLLLLYGILALVGGYTVVIIFYAFNSGWVTPFIVTPTNDKILDLTTKLVTSREEMASLVNDRDRLQGSLSDLHRTAIQLQGLDTEFQTAIGMQNQGNTADLPALAALTDIKKQDITATDTTLKQMDIIEGQIDKDLAAHLITKGDAATAKTALRQNRNLATDGKIAEVLLRDSMRQKMPDYTTSVDVLAKKAELKSVLTQLTIQVNSGEEQLSTDKLQIAELGSAIKTAGDSPYYLATKGGVRFAFVPYDNQGGVIEGAAVYGCVLSMVVCRKVGTVKKIFFRRRNYATPDIQEHHPGVFSAAWTYGRGSCKKQSFVHRSQAATFLRRRHEITTNQRCYFVMLCDRLCPNE